MSHFIVSLQTFAIAVSIVVVLVSIIFAYATVSYEISRIRAGRRNARYSKNFFANVEEYRNDFSKRRS